MSLCFALVEAGCYVLAYCGGGGGGGGGEWDMLCASEIAALALVFDESFMYP